MSKRRRDARRQTRRKQQKGTTGEGMDNMSPKEMQKALSQIDTNEVEDVVEVIIRTKSEEIVMSQPEVTIMNMGQEIWNIVPKSIERRPLTSIDSEIPAQEVEIKPEDVQLIVSTANVSEDEAIKALQKSGGDIAAAIMRLK